MANIAKSKGQKFDQTRIAISVKDAGNSGWITNLVNILANEPFLSVPKAEDKLEEALNRRDPIAAILKRRG